MTEDAPAERPIITLDFDGVICEPPFGINLGIRADFLDPTVPPRPARVPPHWFSAVFDRVRFDLRRPMPGIEAALRDLHAVRTVYVLTGRRTSPQRWLRRHHLEAYVDSVIINDSALRSPHFKLAALQRLGASAHVDDDGRTAQLIAAGSDVHVYLVDWPRNRGPHYHDRVTRVASLAAAVEELTARSH
jgi:hypothetical protein